MKFLERLQAHRGSLINIKSRLYWYGGQGWDENPGRTCLLISVGVGTDVPDLVAVTGRGDRGRPGAKAHLLVDGQPKWVWVAERDVELL